MLWLGKAGALGLCAAETQSVWDPSSGVLEQGESSQQVRKTGPLANSAQAGDSLPAWKPLVS